VSLDITVTVISEGSCINIAQVHACDQADLDSTPNNDGGDQSEDDEDNAMLTAYTPGVALDPAAKNDTLLIDADGDGFVSSGDTILYEIIIWNEGTADATGVVFTDTPDPNTTLVAGSVNTSQGTINTGNNLVPPDTSINIAVGTLPAGGPALGNATFSFLVTVNDQLPPGLRYIYNQGLFTSDNAPPEYTNDPDTGENDDPTGTRLGAGVRGVPVFPNLYLGVIAAIGAGLLAYFIRRTLVHQ